MIRTAIATAKGTFADGNICFMLIVSSTTRITIRQTIWATNMYGRLKKKTVLIIAAAANGNYS